MYIDITDFFTAAAPMDYSASVAEIGRNAGQDTWRAAIEDAPEYPLLDTEEKRQAFRDHAVGYGAWSEDEIAAWSDDELTALFIQMISGEMREFESLAGSDWGRWRVLCDSGTCSGAMFGGPLSVDGRIYFYIGS